ncbi:MAG: glycosyltransferase family 4 protein [Anaerolineae bacterium]
MRIGIDYTPAVQQRAGIGRYTRCLVDALAELDRENEYVLFAGTRGGGPVRRDWPPNFRLRTVPLTDRHLAILWHRLRLPLPVDLLTGPVDLFHSPDFTLPPLWQGKAIVTIHDLSFLRYPQGAEPNLRAYLERVVPRAVARADLVLADSQSTKKDLIELLGVESDRIEVVYPGVEARFRPLDDEDLLARVRARYGLDAPFILSVGTLEPRKNFVRLIEAYALLRERAAIPHRLVIAGGKGWLYEGIFARVEELGLEDDVRFLGFVPDEDLPALYNLADLFVFPSLYEGFGLPPLEAMACGTPVVTSNVSSLPEVVVTSAHAGPEYGRAQRQASVSARQGEAGLMVEATDVEGLAEAMERALGDRTWREEAVQRGLAQAGKFTWRAAAEKLVGLYEKVEGMGPH